MNQTSPSALIIEDEVEAAHIFAIALKSAGFEVTTVSDGHTALAWLAENTPQLIVLDLHLPHLSGDKVLAAIRADARLKSAVVFITSADARMSDELSTQADKILDKPVSFRHLRDLATGYREAMSGTTPE